MAILAYLNTWPGSIMAFIVYMTARIMRPRNHFKGYLWRAFCHYRVGRLCRDEFLCFLGLYLFAVGLFGVLEILSGVKGLVAVPWLLLVVSAIDDYFNGDDDDRKRRWEGVKNKIKWLMQLPPAPEPGQVRSCGRVG